MHWFFGGIGESSNPKTGPDHGNSKTDTHQRLSFAVSSIHTSPLYSLYYSKIFRLIYLEWVLFLVLTNASINCKTNNIQKLFSLFDCPVSFGAPPPPLRLSATVRNIPHFCGDIVKLL